MSMMSMSPEVQAHGQLPSAEQAEELFKQRFSEMAYSVMMAKFPELAAQIVTFKLVETEAENGKGIGVFILLLEDKTIYLPVIMVDSQLKPFDMFYYKDLNIFLPLSQDWLDEVSKSSLSTLGEPAKFPQGMQRDMSVRDLVVPPVMPEGRMSLACDMSEMFKAASYKPKIIFLEFLKNASSPVLDGVRTVMKKNPGFAKNVTGYYGNKALSDAFREGYEKDEVKSRRKKTASVVFTPYVRIFSPDSARRSLPEIKNKCGVKIAEEVFKAIATEGLAAVDTRPQVKNTVVKVESPVHLSPVTSAGFYYLYFPDQQKKLCLVAPAITGSCESEYVILLADGSKGWSCFPSVKEPLLSEQVLSSKIPKETTVYKVLAEKTRNRPTNHAHNIPVYVSSRGILQVGAPVYVSNLVDNSDGTVTFENGHIDKDDSRGKIMRTPSSTFYPAGTSWFSVPEPWKNELEPVSDPKMLTRWVNDFLADKTEEIPVKSAGMEEWWIPGEPSAVFRDDAVTKVAVAYDLSLKDAVRVIDNASYNGRCTLRLIKKAQDTYPQEALPAQEDPNMGMMDPNMGMMDPNMGMMGPPQPSISPTDLAIAETVQNLQQENEIRMQQIQDQMLQQQQAMQMEMESNQKLIEVLSRIQERSNTIGQATNGMVPPEALESPSAAGQMLAPEPPPEEPPPPMPMMQEGPISGEMVASQIHPELAEQAGELQDAGMFDTSVMAVMAAAPLLREIVSTYIPNLEKALDNLGRIQLTLWMREAETKTAIGNDAFVHLEEKLRNVFKGLGEIVLQVNRNALDSEESAMQAQRMLGDQQ